MKIKYVLVGVLAIGLLSGLVSPVSAQRGPGFGGPGGGMMGPGKMRMGPEKLFRNLNLTADQKAKLLDVRQAMEKELLPYEQKNEPLMIKMREEMTKDSPDLKTIENYLKESNQNRLTVELKRAEFMLKSWVILTPEQKEKFRKTEKEIWNKMKKGDR